MGQGQDKVARNLVDLQPTAIVELFLLYLDTVDKETAFIAFHGGSIFAKPITWQGIEYLPIPVETEGFEITANSELPRPKIRISNKDYFVTDLLNKHQDLQFAKIIRKRTFVKFLDDVNFDGGNPWGQADSSAEISNDTYLIGQKTAENKLFVELELTSPLDLENFEVNNRIILSRYCSWYYRGNGCNYDGPPIETEEGESIFINNENNWANASVNYEWVTGKNYSVGDPAFLVNKKITLNDGISNPKIWYAVKTAHLSTNENRPDLNPNYWLKDGCTKKLHSCKKRFQNSDIQVLFSVDGTFTNNYVNFSYLNNTTVTNNIAPLATVTTSSVYKNDRNFSGTKAVDYIVGATAQNINNIFSVTDGNKWVANDNKGTLRLDWGSTQTINQVNIWDANKSEDLKNAVITFYNGPTQVDQLTLANIPTNGQTPGILSFAPKTITALRVSGSGVVGNLTSISEIQVLNSSSSPGLVFDNSVDKIHTKNSLHIAMWFNFPNGKKADTIYQILHNIEKNPNSTTNYVPSGLCLYALNNDLILEFPVSYVLKNGTTYTDAFETQQIKLTNWPFTTEMPLHIKIYKGGANGINPTASNIDSEGSIEVSSVNKIKATYTLPSQAPVKDTAGKTLTEKSNKPSYFRFKNSSYQGGISSNLYLGIRNYDYHGETITSNMKIASFAVWTALKNQASMDWFNRLDSITKLYNGTLSQKYPRTYQELLSSSINTTLETNLFAWWQMNLTNSAPYVVNSSNSPTKTLYLTGTYSSSIDQSNTRNFKNVKTITQTPKTSLPFGGFPGTDTYGR
jgi:lambda family phage minor tail protein L